MQSVIFVDHGPCATVFIAEHMTASDHTTRKKIASGGPSTHETLPKALATSAYGSQKFFKRAAELIGAALARAAGRQETGKPRHIQEIAK
jgi:hypothetical protein